MGHIILFVNSKANTDFGQTFHTNDISFFKKNLKIVGDDYNKSFMDAYKENGGKMIDMQIIGKYITIIQLDINESNAQMIFHDTENNEEKAIGVATSLMFSGSNGTMNDNWMKHFMRLFNELKSTYNERENMVSFSYGEIESN